MQIKTQMVDDPWHRLIFHGLTDKELLRQTKHSKKIYIFERSASALASISKRGRAFETKQLPLPHLFCLLLKVMFVGTIISQLSEGLENHTISYKYILL